MAVTTFPSFHFSKLSFQIQFHPTPFSARALRLKPSSAAPICAAAVTPPARDRVIDFGKHKGRMLGTLPSAYLKWVSKNLRARDFEDWAKLADQVLEDPVYQDRIEWEFADNILRGNRPMRSEGSGVVSELLEISERFGWDNDDKAGWKRVNFELLGTSKGGRIPRMSRSVGGERMGMEMATESMEGGGRRRERRERVRKKRDREVLGNGSESEREGKSGGELGEEREEMDEKEKGRKRFPGREALLSMVNRKSN